MTRKEIDRLNEVRFSRFRNDAGLMAKRFELAPDGTLRKTAAAMMTRGTVETVSLSLVELPAFLAALKSNEAIGLGICGQERANIVTEKALPQSPGAIARTQAFFKWCDGPALGYFDADTDAPVDDVLAALAKAFPAFEDAAKIVFQSSSAGIYRTGEDKPIAKSRGLHIYFTVANGADFARFGEAICKRLWLAGYGHIVIGNAGQMLIRQTIDAATFMSQGIIFEAAPILGPGLERRAPAPTLIDGGALDTTLCLDLTPEENARYQQLVVAAKADKEPETKPIREEYLLRRGKDISTKRNIPLAEAIQIVARAMEGQPLEGSFPLHFEKFGEVSVADVLLDLAKYDGHILLDPMEPDYPSRFCAIFYANTGRDPCIYSQAHGGQTYPIVKPPQKDAAAAEAAPPDPTSPEAIRLQLWRIFNTPGITAPQMHRACCAPVVAWLHLRGMFYHLLEQVDFEGALYFDSVLKILRRIRSDDYLAWLSDSLGINRAERAFAMIQSAVETESLSGRATGIQPALYWTSRPGAIYLSNGPGHVAKVTASGVEIVDNGTDGVVFPADSVLMPWRLTTPADPFQACGVFREMSTSALHGKMLFKLWAVALPSDQRTKPPLVNTGPVGSGKTKIVSDLFEFYGMTPRINAVNKSSEGDFWPSVNGGGLTCFDNADARIEWLPDALAAASTGGISEKRKLYTNSERVILRPRAWIAITSFNPQFAADAGLSDRLLVVRLNRREGSTAEATLTDEVRAARDAGLSWICDVLAIALADTAPVPECLNQRHPDFAAMAVRIGRAMGQETEAVAALRSAEQDKSLFNLENDSIAATILEMLRNGIPFAGTASELLERLKLTDPSLEGKLSVKRLSNRISKLWPHMEAALQAEREVGHGGAMRYTLRPPRNGDTGDIQTAFPEKFLCEGNIGSLYETPNTSHPCHREDLFAGFTSNPDAEEGF